MHGDVCVVVAEHAYQVNKYTTFRVTTDPDYATDYKCCCFEQSIETVNRPDLRQLKTLLMFVFHLLHNCSSSYGCRRSSCFCYKLNLDNRKRCWYFCLPFPVQSQPSSYGRRHSSLLMSLTFSEECGHDVSQQRKHCVASEIPWKKSFALVVSWFTRRLKYPACFLLLFNQFRSYIMSCPARYS